ncbi:hypothetical protein N7507_010072 [Penicillium longicatenatum]|nr:hypothetical protein N7507_010072 [Penicillium longicatenatum]
MKFILALCCLVASALAASADNARPQYPDNTMPQYSNGEQVTLHFANELGSQPNTVSVDFPLDRVPRDVMDVMEGGSDQYVSAIQVTDQSGATSTFSCDVRVMGRFFGTFTPTMTYKSIGQSVRLSRVSVQCRP